MKKHLSLGLIALLPFSAFAEQPSFKEKYDLAAKDMIPALQISTCKTKAVKKVQGKTITKCHLHIPNALLTLNNLDNKLTNIRMELDASQLGHPSDLPRAGGVLLRAARGADQGNYLDVSNDMFSTSMKNKGKKACTDDHDSSSRFCVSSNDGKIFDVTLSPI